MLPVRSCIDVLRRRAPHDVSARRECETCGLREIARVLLHLDREHPPQARWCSRSSYRAPNGRRSTVTGTCYVVARRRTSDQFTRKWLETDVVPIITEVRSWEQPCAVASRGRLLTRCGHCVAGVRSMAWPFLVRHHAQNARLGWSRW